MNDLLQSQIRDSCRLALPEGLKDLMADISREVLRSQPPQIYQFIADYLSVLLVTREHLFIASRVCDDVCKDRCWLDLDEELRKLTLSEEDVKTILKIVETYFSQNEVNEGSLLQKLIQKTNIGQEELPATQDAIRRAFLRHRVTKMVSEESPSTDNKLDEIALAANHTLKIYKKATEDSENNYDCVASKIQAAYRAYNVRRKRGVPLPEASDKKSNNLRFKNKKEKLAADLIKRCASKCSSLSLAGSFVSLPLYRPYSVMSDHHDTAGIDEIGITEKEHTNIDYISEDARDQHETYDADIKVQKKIINFHHLPKVEEVDYNYSDVVDEADYEKEEYEDEEIEEVLDEGFVINEGMNEDGNGIHTDSPNDKDEHQENGDEIAETKYDMVSEYTIEESDLGGGWFEEGGDETDPMKSEISRIYKEGLAHLTDDSQERHDIS